MACFTIAMDLGAVLGNTLLGYIAEAVGFLWMFRVVVLLILLALVPLWRRRAPTSRPTAASGQLIVEGLCLKIFLGTISGAENNLVSWFSNFVSWQGAPNAHSLSSIIKERRRQGAKRQTMGNLFRLLSNVTLA